MRIPRHEPGPPETLTNSDYANLLRVPDRRTLAGKRDHALLRVLGDCGLRSAELRGLRARDLRRPRSNARHYRLYVHGKGGREREVPVPRTYPGRARGMDRGPPARARRRAARRGAAVRPHRTLRRRAASPPSPAVAVHRLVRRGCQAAGVPIGSRTRTRCARIGRPAASSSGFPCMRSPPGSGTRDLRTTARYTATRPERIEEIAEVLDRAPPGRTTGGSGDVGTGVRAANGHRRSPSPHVL